LLSASFHKGTQFLFHRLKLLSNCSETALSHAHALLSSGRYPGTVRDGYLNFHGWLLAKNTVGAVTYVLATHSLLTAVGVGSGAALPLSASISWILKDGLGCLGQVLAAHRLGTR
jgi:Vitamin B6 photo-protection and homoeostasis